MKLVVNKCYGGFGVSKAVYDELGLKWDGYGYLYGTALQDRSNPQLVAAVEKLGKKANGSCAELEVIKIPDGIEWEINNYDGIETVHEKHRSW
jgi:hypothetical protein